MKLNLDTESIKDIECIKILGCTYKVVFKDKVLIHSKEEPEYVFGTCNQAQRTVEISLKDAEDNPLVEDVLRVTFYHELAHTILCEGEYRQSNDEPLVEWLGKNIKYFIENNEVRK